MKKLSASIFNLAFIVPIRPALTALFITLLFSSCKNKTEADLIVKNAMIYTVDSAFTIVQAMAIKDGKIIATGTNESILTDFDSRTIDDLDGKSVYPGFIDAHAHFMGYGLSLNTVNLVETTSWQDVLDRVSKFAQNNKEGWLIGRGWDQNDWQLKQFPTNESLDSLFPDRPVLLTRIDGHAAIANKAALNLAGVQNGMRISGGDIVSINGKLSGLLVDNAVDLVSSKIPAPGAQQIKTALLGAQQNCFAFGLTTVDDCGISATDTQILDSLHKTGDLKMKVYAMLSDDKRNFDYLFAKGKIKTDRLNVRSFKVYADGALGSRGASLLADYTDRPGWKGFLLSNPAHFDSVAAILSQKGFQMCTHAIGDSGNRTILNTYAKYLEPENDLRWRIEHAQVVNPADFEIFGRYNIIPSVQPTHATSDMYWAEERLGPQRVKGAYAFKDLLKQNGWIPLGTDFPVEDISTFKTFYAAVVRKDAKGWPAEGYQVENALTREEALRGMTIWAAKSNFEENEKGSLEKNKSADFIILDQDLMNAAPGDLLKLKVLKTYINGEKVYSN
ncbi:amidohydrolase [Flavitalea sp.]|nr:amidohydrolase [Flavitalea sp.]